MNSKYRDLTKNTALFAISSFGTKILSFLLVPLYTNILSTAEYGIADILSTTTTLLIVVFTINIADGILVFALDKKNHPEEILSFGMRIFMTGWFVLMCGSLILNFFRIICFPAWYYIFIVLYFGASAVYQILSNYLRARDDVQDVAIAGILSSAAFILSNVLFLLIIKIGLTGYLISTIVGPIIGCIFYLWHSGISWKIVFTSKCDRTTQQAMIKYCMPLIFNSIALWINSCLDRYFVTAICGVAQNGIYSVANKIPVILSTFYTVFSQAWTLSAVKEFDKEDKDGFFSKTYMAYNAVMSIVCSLLILFNIPIAKIIYAKDFFEAWQYSSVLLVGVMFNSLTAFLGSIFSATKKSNILAVTTVISAVINTVLNAVFIPLFGVQGAAVATAVALASMWLIRIICVRKLIDLHFNLLPHICGYILISIQAAVEHTDSHCYFIQILLLCLLVILYRGYLKYIINLVGFISKRKKGR